jgi:hypothetical protein
MRSKNSEAKFRQFASLFCVDLNATQIGMLTGMNRNTVNRLLMVAAPEGQAPASGETKVDESYFGASAQRAPSLLAIRLPARLWAAQAPSENLWTLPTFGDSMYRMERVTPMSDGAGHGAGPVRCRLADGLRAAVGGLAGFVGADANLGASFGMTVAPPPRKPAPTLTLSL